ncbi:hypothetical protein [Gibbsiella quercinecans]|uniref:Uncharacterized protein n=1 Tax=Gibbsiella quercinecans TaxID=929813 RepID=A0A250B2Q9_9GAMM|nr:hypothetical protein [Gibbsiella quercinecans]ATA20533.1 hypothetical protein AWC35_14930 [Gibbsiella quercinecans]RLM07542.1 hypothetical protein BIY30_14800 [Gibbsiella quercinecans]
MLAALTPYLAIAAAIVGASLQYLFTRHIEQIRAQREMKTKAYMDYLKGVCEQAQVSRIEDPKQAREKLTEAFTIVADAKARICLYGADKVVHSFAEFEKLGASMGTEEQRRAFIAMAAAMRKDAGLSTTVSLDDIGVVLLGKR